MVLSLNWQIRQITILECGGKPSPLQEQAPALILLNGMPFKVGEM